MQLPRITVVAVNLSHFRGRISQPEVSGSDCNLKSQALIGPQPEARYLFCPLTPPDRRIELRSSSPGLDPILFSSDIGTHL